VSGSVIRVCVTGPESTGKTTLATRLAEWARADVVPEASRRYAERTTGELRLADVSPIAREHIALAEAARGPLAVIDTDLLSTVLYSRHYYGAVPRWILRAEHDRRADLYLLCDVDVPWVPDGVRDRPSNRDEMFALFRDALARRKARTVVIRGDWERRWTTARDALSEVIGEARRGRRPRRADSPR
jgi:NadR type nicotinamide-nucleotide adenylyltransferase